MRILAGGSCEMRESPAECVRVGNYGLKTHWSSGLQAENDNDIEPQNQ